MARTDVTTQQITRDGLHVILSSPTVTGDVIDTGAVALYVDNASGGSINVTVQATASQDGLNVEDLVVAVPAGQAKFIGPLPARTFGQPSGTDKGRAYVDYSSVTSVTRAVVSF